ncbi:integrase [Streptomyces sp. APSN-46.1]|uniref:integrase n=1 Tax=Streptomyces sp. APSN-46.1 TaxID=2929049 RepID=UPI001FB406E5|nr:integrase [Streptomyces sp. APSN-46.1]MCJ1676187.1 integrase [Streptomyces sp. APSN-46.1]
MIIAKPGGRTRSLFRLDEPVVQGRPLLPQARQEGARVPLFGDTGVMDFNGVVAKPANRNPSWWRIRFAGVLAEPHWNLLAREIVMILANPQHEQLQAHGLHFGFDPGDIGTINMNIGCLRGLITWARDEGLPHDPGYWSTADLKQRISALRTQVEPATLTRHVAFLKKLASFAPALSCAWSAEDPWPGTLAGRVAKDVRDGELSTKAIPPEIWFPLIRAAWTYIHTFAPDILAALRLTEQLRRAAVASAAGKDVDLDRFLADPANKVPCHHDAEWPADLPPEVNWSMLCLLLGVQERFLGSLFGRSSAASRARRAKVLRAVHQGRCSYGLPLELTQVRRPDGSTGPWHPGFDLYELSNLATTLRNAAFVLVAALSMMRDSELQEIARGSVVEHYNAPAIASTLVKGREGRPRKHWWISEPVAEAITVAETISPHPKRVFVTLAPGAVNEELDGGNMVDSFIASVNHGTTWSGLEPIPKGKVRPHMFRRTMAMLTDQFAGSEIALGMQLKHIATRALANRATRAYAAPDPAWTEHLEQAVHAARFRRLKDLYEVHGRGENIGFGPGAERLKDAFDQIAATVRARHGDTRVETDLLGKARITIRFGILNNCLFDERHPAGAVCLENAVVPDGHTGPLEDRCRPDRCPNSMITSEHAQLYEAHHRTQLNLLQTPGLPACRKALITREAERAEAVLHKIRGTSP